MCASAVPAGGPLFIESQEMLICSIHTVLAWNNDSGSGVMSITSQKDKTAGCLDKLSEFPIA